MMAKMQRRQTRPESIDDDAADRGPRRCSAGCRCALSVPICVSVKPSSLCSEIGDRRDRVVDVVVAEHRDADRDEHAPAPDSGRGILDCESRVDGHPGGQSTARGAIGVARRARHASPLHRRDLRHGSCRQSRHEGDGQANRQRRHQLEPELLDDEAIGPRLLGVPEQPERSLADQPRDQRPA